MFRTPIQIEKCPLKIGLETPVLSVGSCFANCIGQKLQAYKFDVLPNPFGVMFNPLSIFKLIQQALEGTSPAEEGYLNQQGLWLHYNFHSSFSAATKPELQANLETALANTKKFLQRAEWATFTWGTALAYTHLNTGKIVANCHKVPARQFDRKLLSVDQIVEAFITLWEQLRQMNPKLKAILTVSPVRHIKDTLPLNQASKATLRLACGQLEGKYPEVEYFPAYEIMMDDLRDYRFYKADMLHPSEQAEEYIWEQFQGTFFAQNTVEFIKKMGKNSKSNGA